PARDLPAPQAGSHLLCWVERASCSTMPSVLTSFISSWPIAVLSSVGGGGSYARFGGIVLNRPPSAPLCAPARAPSAPRLPAPSGRTVPHLPSTALVFHTRLRQARAPTAGSRTHHCSTPPATAG